MRASTTRPSVGGIRVDNSSDAVIATLRENPARGEPYFESPTIILEKHPPSAFSLPEEVLSYKAKAEDIRTIFKNGDSERKMYTYTELTQAELQSIKAFREKQEANQWELFSPLMDARLLRYLSHARGNVDKCYKCLQETARWREEFFKKPVRDTEVLKYLQTGFCYIAGRDKGMRPLLVIRLERAKKITNIDLILRMFAFLLEYMYYFLHVPGTVEANVCVIDLKNCGATTVPFNLIKSVLHVLSHHYVGRLYKNVIMNAPYWVSMCYNNLVSPLLTDRQRNKVCFASDNSVLLSMFAPQQLEKQYGGTRPTLTEFYPSPLEPGPFEPSSKRPNENSVENCFSVLGNKSRDGVLHVDAETKKAHQIWAPGSWKVFQNAGVPIPPNEYFEDGKGAEAISAEEVSNQATLQRQVTLDRVKRRKSEREETERKRSISALSSATANDLVDGEVLQVTASPEGEVEVDLGAVVDTAKVEQASWWSCMSCKCT